MGEALKDESQLWLIVRAAHLVLAIPSPDVIRILLRDEVPGGGDTVQVDGLTYARASLSSLLGLDEEPRSIALVTVGRGDAAVAVALEMGLCLGARQIGAVTPLPPRHFSSRVGAVLGAFIAQPSDEVPIGLALSLPHLFGAHRVAQLRTAIGRAR